METPNDNGGGWSLGADSQSQKVEKREGRQPKLRCTMGAKIIHFGDEGDGSEG